MGVFGRRAFRVAGGVLLIGHRAAEEGSRLFATGWINWSFRSTAAAAVLRVERESICVFSRRERLWIDCVKKIIENVLPGFDRHAGGPHGDRR